MSRRRSLTAADYAAMAICPSLIVVMLAALMHFVILCLYRGPYAARLTYILFMFIMGATGIARISIEFGRAHASLYAGALGLAVVVVLSTFTNFLLAIFVVTLVWFLADRITFDCTVIDEGKDASGEGLIEAGGLFGGKRPSEQPDVSLDGTTDHSLDAAPASSPDRARGKRKKTHKPGRTVFYLALAALPLFGLGQLFLPGQEGVRNQAALALGVYLFATLTLLVVTSFLGLRRYLRQRGAEMPSDVSIAWVAGGAVLTALLLLACFALPLPGHFLAVAELPAIESPDWLTPSRFGWGDEGMKQDGPADPDVAKVSQPSDASTAETDASREGQQPGGSQGKGEPGPSGKGSQGNPSSSSSPEGASPPDSQGQSEKSGNQGQNSGTGKPGDRPGSRETGSRGAGEQAGSDGDAGSRGSQEPSSPQGEGPSKTGGSEASDTADASQDESSGDQSETSGASSNGSEASRSEGNAGDQAGGVDGTEVEPAQAADRGSAEEGEAPSSSPSDGSSLPSLGTLFSALGTLFRVLLILGLLAIIVIFLLKNPQLWRQWLDALAHLFEPGAKPTAESLPSVATDTGPPPRPFTSFSNPLGSGGDPRRAIVVTFQACEAWAREFEHPRHENETPTEFARRLGHTHRSMGPAVQRLAEAYNRIVYGRSQAGPRDLEAASQVWQEMTKPRPRATPVGEPASP